MSQTTTQNSNKQYIVDRYFTEIEKVYTSQKKSGGGGSGGPSFSRDHEVEYGGTASLGSNPPDALHAMRPCSNVYRASSVSADLTDLIYLPGPFTEHALYNTLQTRFYAANYNTRIGQIMISVNPFTESPSLHALRTAASVSRDASTNSSHNALSSMLAAVCTRLRETHIPQSIVLSGISGSGKTFTSQLLVRQLYELTGGGTETDSYKHLNASLTVLREMGTAATVNNEESSRIGYFLENLICDGSMHRTKIHCYPADPWRVARVQSRERNYHVFYRLMDGLSQDDKEKYHLSAYDVTHLHYLNQGLLNADKKSSKSRFKSWKASLAKLGVPVPDVLRVLSAILLLGNVSFSQGEGLELNVQGETELQHVASLLGLPYQSILHALTQTTKPRSQNVFSFTHDPSRADSLRDALAVALYSRTLTALVKRSNSNRLIPSSSPACVSSNESGSQGQKPPTYENVSLHTSQTNEGSGGHSKKAGKAGSSSRTSSLHTTSSGMRRSEGFVGILDMIGFEDLQTNHLEQIAINLSAETLEHFYTTHVFKMSEEVCLEEGIQLDMDVHYTENAPVVELISSQCVGILSILEAEGTLQNCSSKSLLQKLRVQHKKNQLLDESSSAEGSVFIIKHFGGKVDYDASQLLTTNKECLPDSIVSIFHKDTCSFGFASHLFSAEMKIMQENGNRPIGVIFRTSPQVSHESYISGYGTYSQDFHTRLNGLLKTLVNTRPTFIRCIKSNSDCKKGYLERDIVTQQVRAYKLLETLHVTAIGYPEHLKYRTFNSRYKIFVPVSQMKGHRDEKSYSLTKVVRNVQLILEEFSKRVENNHTTPFTSTHWALGKKHIFLSEAAYQQLEEQRGEIMTSSATLIQACWRRHVAQQRWPFIRRQLLMRKRPSACQFSDTSSVRNVRQFPNAVLDRQSETYDGQLSLRAHALDKEHRHGHSSNHGHASSLYGLDMNTPPPVPPSRNYTVIGNVKIGFPQTRVMKQNYTDTGNVMLMRGQEVVVTGPSHIPGCLLVHFRGSSIHVPHQVTQLMPQRNDEVERTGMRRSRSTPQISQC